MSFARYPSLNGQSVLITGGASGIGADMVAAFADQGAKVGFIDLQDAEGQHIADQTGAVFVHADLTDISALKEAIASIAKANGPVKTLINNAANDKRENLANVTPDDWDLSQNINLRPQFFAAQAVHEDMAKDGGGSIINLASIIWRFGGHDMVPYATAKSAVIGLTKSLAHAFGDDNIRVNAIEPGAIFTEKQRRLWFPDETDVQAMVDQQLLRHTMDGGEIARMALFLASDDARMITNQTFTVDAGLV